jgi:V/A-type H+-transporting ATPase subunit A
VLDLKTRMQRGKEIAEQINILGDDGVPVDYHETFWKSEIIDFVLLQQDAFDEVDAVSSLERQEEIMDVVTEICEHEFQFSNFLDVTDYFKKLINLCKQMNYSQFKSEQYEDYKRQIREAIEGK